MFSRKVGGTNEDVSFVLYQCRKCHPSETTYRHDDQSACLLMMDGDFVCSDCHKFHM